MANLFEYEKEAIRIKAVRMDETVEEVRRFSVDPNITSFEVLQNILCRAFELPSTDISIKYLHRDRNGKDVWSPLLSDWDLDTAILGSADLGLELQVWMLECGLDPADTKGIVSGVLETGNLLAKELKPVHEAAVNAKSVGVIGIQGLLSKSSTQASGFLKRQYENIPGLASKMKTALNMDIKDRFEDLSNKSVSDEDFRRFLNKVGQLVSPREFRLSVYKGGLEPGIRKVAWKHLLNIYPAGLTGRERVKYLQDSSATYLQLKSDWMDLVLQGRITDDVKTVINMVRKDVLRTDRQHAYFAGEGNQNVMSLFNILTTYALNHSSVSYCQGMSDLASPILVTMGDEAHAYICFTALMERMKPNFMLDGVAMTTKFQHLSEGLMYYDPEFYTYLKLHMADDLLFCYRWLLLEMKREFPFEMALKALEVTWSSLPPATADTNLCLWETRFSPKMSPSTSDLSKPCETAYGKVAALRKLSVDRQLSDNTDVRKRSVCNRGRFASDNCESVKGSGVASRINKSASTMSALTKRRGFSIGSNKSSIEEKAEVVEANSGEATKKDANSKRKFSIGGGKKKVPEKTKTSQSSEDGGEGEQDPSGKRVTNLKDFYSLTTKPGSETVIKTESAPGQKPVPSTSVTEPAVQVTEASVVDCSGVVGTVSPCTEAKPIPAGVGDGVTGTAEETVADPFDFVGYSQANAALTIYCNRLPPPTKFGHGNPFLMFLCLASLLQHRNYIMDNQLDYQDIAMFFDKKVRGHNVDRVLRQARSMFAEYLNEDWSPSPGHPGGQQTPSC